MQICKTRGVRGGQRLQPCRPCQEIEEEGQGAKTAERAKGCIWLYDFFTITALASLTLQLASNPTPNLLDDWDNHYSIGICSSPQT